MKTTNKMKWILPVGAVVIVLALVVAFSAKRDTSFETENYKVSVTHTHYNEQRDGLPIPTMENDHVVLCGTMGQIAFNLINHQSYIDSTFDSYTGPTLYPMPSGQKHKAQYRIEITAKKKNAAPDFIQVVSELVKRKLVASDTTYQNMWVMKTGDGQKLASMYSSDSNSYVTLKGIVSILRMAYSLPVMLDKDADGEYTVHYNTGKTWREKDEYISFLKNTYGLVVEEQPHQRMQVVSFK